MHTSITTTSSACRRRCASIPPALPPRPWVTRWCWPPMRIPPSTTRSCRQSASSPTTTTRSTGPSSNWPRRRTSAFSPAMTLAHSLPPKAPVALTMGDPAGIGPEIIARLWAEGGLPPALVIGEAAIMGRAVRIVGAALAIHRIDRIEEAEFRPGTVDVLQAGTLPADLAFGRIDARAGAAAYGYVAHAVRE